MATKLSKPPSATTHMNRRLRFMAMQAPARKYVNTCAARWSVSSPAGTTVTSRTCTPKATTTSHRPRISTSDSRLSLPPATGTVTSSRRKASARVIRRAGAGGSIQVFVTDGFRLVGANLTWTDVGRPNVHDALARLDALQFRPMERARCRSTHRLRPRPNRGGIDALEAPPDPYHPPGQGLPLRG